MPCGCAVPSAGAGHRRQPLPRGVTYSEQNNFPATSAGRPALQRRGGCVRPSTPVWGSGHPLRTPTPHGEASAFAEPMSLRPRIDRAEGQRERTFLTADQHRRMAALLRRGTAAGRARVYGISTVRRRRPTRAIPTQGHELGDSRLHRDCSHFDHAFSRLCSWNSHLLRNGNLTFNHLNLLSNRLPEMSIAGV